MLKRQALVQVCVLCVVSGCLTSVIAGQSRGAPPQGARPTAAPIEQDIIKLSQEWFDALNRGDIKALEQFETNDFIAVQPAPQGVALMNKQGQLDSMRKVTNRVSVKRELRNTQVRTYGSTAILTALASYQGQDATGKPIALQGFNAEVWVNEAGRWRIAHFQTASGLPRPGTP